MPLATDQKVGGSSPSERARPEATCDHETASTVAKTVAKPLTSRSEQLIDRVGRFLAKHRRDMDVGVHRDADLSVPEHLHDGPRGNGLGKQERGTPVPQVMQPEPRTPDMAAF